ncbi:conserved hypothetical protein [Candidatus Terasakiella magnetica]|nr:conserved hypothetical protein [Candidatus Terasakiella magnetica]
MRDDDLASLADRIAQAWVHCNAGGAQQERALAQLILAELREIHAHGRGRATGVAGAVRSETSVKLICCPECDCILRDYAALARHRRFCVMGAHR